MRRGWLPKVSCVLRRVMQPPPLPPLPLLVASPSTPCSARLCRCLGLAFKQPDGGHQPRAVQVLPAWRLQVWGRLRLLAQHGGRRVAGALLAQAFQEPWGAWQLPLWPAPQLRGEMAWACQLRRVAAGPAPTPAHTPRVPLPRLPPQVCKFYLRGECSYGDRCRYMHTKPEWARGRREGGAAAPAGYAAPPEPRPAADDLAEQLPISRLRLGGQALDADAAAGHGGSGSAALPLPLPLPLQLPRDPFGGDGTTGGGDAAAEAVEEQQEQQEYEEGEWEEEGGEYWEEGEGEWYGEGEGEGAYWQQQHGEQEGWHGDEQAGWLAGQPDDVTQQLGGGAQQPGVWSLPEGGGGQPGWAAGGSHPSLRSLCMQWFSSGACGRGDRCQLVHGELCQVGARCAVPRCAVHAVVVLRSCPPTPATHFGCETSGAVLNRPSTLLLPAALPQARAAPDRRPRPPAAPGRVPAAPRAAGGARGQLRRRVFNLPGGGAEQGGPRGAQVWAADGVRGAWWRLAGWLARRLAGWLVGPGGRRRGVPLPEGVCAASWSQLRRGLPPACRCDHPFCLRCIRSWRQNTDGSVDIDTVRRSAALRAAGCRPARGAAARRPAVVRGAHCCNAAASHPGCPCRPCAPAPSAAPPATTSFPAWCGPPAGRRRSASWQVGGAAGQRAAAAAAAACPVSPCCFCFPAFLLIAVSGTPWLALAATRRLCSDAAPGRSLGACLRAAAARGVEAPSLPPSLPPALPPSRPPSLPDPPACRLQGQAVAHRLPLLQLWGRHLPLWVRRSERGR